MELKQNEHLSKQIVMNSNFGQKGFRPCKLHHHSQISRMVDCELCNECKRKNSTRVLHFQK
jgi:hypothetical protein